MSDGHYDVIVIGSGPGGASLAHRLAPSGKRILVLERGGYLPRERVNWDVDAVFNQGRYKAAETWFDADGAPFAPMVHYGVGGNSKLYGAALVRLRRADFDALPHAGGLSPAWPIAYDALDPYYLEAERLYHVHGARGEDPSEPNATAPFPYPPVAHEPRIGALDAVWRAQGLRPFHLPLGIRLDQRPGSHEATPQSPCIRCAAFDGFPCLTNGKADAQVVCIDPLATAANVCVRTGARVERLETDPRGTRIVAVEARRDDQVERYTGDIVVVACGAINSALLLLRSANAAHPDGLANGSGQVGRNYLCHNQSVTLAISRVVNDTVFQKTLGLTDFYFGDRDWPRPMGFIQMCGKIHGQHVRGETLPPWLGFLPDLPFDATARHSLDFWLSSEDLPDPANRVRLDRDGRVVLERRANNLEAHRRLQQRLGAVLEAMDERFVTLAKPIPLEGVSHQAGTLRMGTDPAASVVDSDCKAHEIDNLYVCDSSVFPAIGAVNPTLTIIANALRVADIVAARLA